MQLNIVSPTKLAYSGTIRKVSVPGANGQLTILPNHTRLFAQLIEGELKVTPEKEEVFYMSIGGGFIEVNRNKVTILVSRVVHEDELNEKEILAAKKRAQDILKQKISPEEYRHAHALLRSCLVDLKVLRRRTRKYTRKSIKSI